MLGKTVYFSFAPALFLLTCWHTLVFQWNGLPHLCGSSQKVVHSCSFSSSMLGLREHNPGTKRKSKKKKKMQCLLLHFFLPRPSWFAIVMGQGVRSHSSSPFFSPPLFNLSCIKAVTDNGTENKWTGDQRKTPYAQRITRRTIPFFKIVFGFGCILLWDMYYTLKQGAIQQRKNSRVKNEFT